MMHLLHTAFQSMETQSWHATQRGGQARSAVQGMQIIQGTQIAVKYKIFHDFMHMRAKTICEFSVSEMMG